MTIRSATSLRGFRDTLVLAGAGKMGSAMLDGWIARGLKPKQIVVIEPHPGKTVKALARRGLKLNPKGKGTPAAAVRGISVAVATANVSTRQRKQAFGLLAAIGKVEWVNDEAMMDAVTALSGSGPAYVFL